MAAVGSPAPPLSSALATPSLQAGSSWITPFDDLPAELLLMLYECLGLPDFVNLTLVLYPTLHRHRLVPDLTPTIVRRLVRGASASSPLAGAAASILQMPMELMLQILRSMEPADAVALVWALSDRFLEFAGPHLDVSTKVQLWVWSRRLKPK